MASKIIYFPMCFNGTDWQTEQALKEKKLICGWATSELYPLIKETYSDIKRNGFSNKLQNNFKKKFLDIANSKNKDNYFTWFFNDDGKNPKRRIGVAWGSIIRFLSINPNDLVYIKTDDDNIIYIAYVKNNSNISFGKTYPNKDGKIHEAYFLENVEFSKAIRKNDLFEKCHALLSEKYPNEKDILLDAIKQNIKHQNGTCLQVLKNYKDLRLKKVFYDALNFYTNQGIEYKTDLRCERMMDIIINHICKEKADNADIVPIFYESLAEAMNNDKLEFDNHLTFNQRTL